LNTHSDEIDLNQYVLVPPPGVTEFGHEGEYLKRLGNLDRNEFVRHVAALEAEAEREKREADALQRVADEMRRRGAAPNDTIGEVFGVN